MIARLLLAGLLASASAAAEPLAFEARPLAVDTSAEAAATLGAFTMIGAFELRADHPGFGGLSGLWVAADGGRMVAVSDAGWWVEADLEHDRDGFLVAVANMTIGRLVDLDGRRIASKRDGDAEALVRAANGDWLVAFEQRHRIWRYPAGEPPFAVAPQELETPAAFAAAPGNGGIEALAMGDDQTLIAIFEKFGDDDTLHGWRLGADAEPFAYPRDGYYRPSDAEVLADGRIMVLERGYTWLLGARARLLFLDFADGRATTRLLGAIESPYPVDNYEALASRTDHAGRTVLYLLSDDNYSAAQRTLLVQLIMDMD